MPHLHRILAFILAPFAALSGAAAWYTWRSHTSSQLWDWASNANLDFGVVYAAGNALALVGSLAAIGVCAAIGPQAASAVGFAAMAAIAGASVFLPAELFIGAWLLLNLLWGYSRVGLWASAALPFHQPYGALRIGLFSVAYAAVNLGAATSGVLSNGIPLLSTDWLIPAIAAGGFGAAALAVGSLGATWFLAPAPTAEDAPVPSTHRFDGQGLILGGVGLVIFLIAEPAWMIAVNAAQDASYQSMPPSTWLYLLNPVIVVPTCLIAGGIASVLVVVPRPVPWFLLPGLAMAISGLTTGLLFLPIPSPELPILAHTALGALMEALMLPILYARLGGDLHWRLQGVPYGLAFAWMSVTSMAWFGVGMLGFPGTFLAGVTGVGELAVGVLLMVAAVPLELYVLHVKSDAELEAEAEALAQAEDAPSASPAKA